MYIGDVNTMREKTTCLCSIEPRSRDAIESNVFVETHGCIIAQLIKLEVLDINEERLWSRSLVFLSAEGSLGKAVGYTLWQHRFDDLNLNVQGGVYSWKLRIISAYRILSLGM